MADSSVLIFKCLNPECTKPVRIRRPQKSGVYPVTCPHCGIKKNLKLKGLEEFPPEAAQGESTSGATTIDNSDKEPIELKDRFLVGKPYTFKCPHCEKKEIGFNSEKPGHKEVTCPVCQGKIGFEVREKTKVIPTGTTGIQHKRGKLVLLRKGWMNKNYALAEGKNTIGRYDESENSDIAIKNDPSMSRRSVEIEMLQTLNGYEFKLTVRKTTNPVLHNDHEIKPGESVSLNFGDSLTMGRTKFRFEQEK